MRIFLVLWVMLLVSPNAFSDETCPGETTRQMEECLASERDDARSELERYRVEVMRLLADRPEVQSAFQASQAAWLEYVEAECVAVYENFRDGSIRNIEMISCQKRLTRQRTWRLWSTYLRGADEDFPEPVLDAS